MTTKTAREIIHMEYKGSKNFMTPNVIKVGKIKRDMAYELSTGQGLEQKTTIYGVTIVSIDNDNNTTRRTELSKCCHSHAEAMEYIEYLKNTALIMDRDPLP